MTALELVEKYKIYIVHEQWNKTTGRYEKVENVIGVANIGTAKRDGMIEELKARKAEIIEAIKNKKAEEKKARDERQAKIDAIEGLAEILAAESRLIEWNLKFDKIIANGESAAFLSSKPSYNFEEALKKYPRAAAYLKAEKLAKSKDEKLAEVGKKALNLIIDGDLEASEKLMNEEKEAHDKQIAEKTRVFDLTSTEDVDALENRWDRERELLEIMSKENDRVEKRVSYDDFQILRDAGELKKKNAVLVNVNKFGPYYTVKNFLEVQNILNRPNTQGETKMTNEKKNELLNAKKILLESFERGEDLTDFSTLSETTKNAFDLLRDFFRDRPDNASRHFWEYKKELSYHRFSDKQDDEHLYAGARLIYRQFLVALTDCVDWYFNEYAETVEE